MYRYSHLHTLSHTHTRTHTLTHTHLSVVVAGTCLVCTHRMYAVRIARTHARVYARVYARTRHHTNDRSGNHRPAENTHTHTSSRQCVRRTVMTMLQACSLYLLHICSVSSLMSNSGLNEPECPVSKQLKHQQFPASKHLKHMKHHKLSLRKTSKNMFRNIYKPAIIRFTVLDYRTCLSD